MPAQPWDLYAKELFPAGFGYPLWKPERGSLNGREICLGDVGRFKDGEFRPLFNSMHDTDHPINQGLNVPGDFQVFCPPNLPISRRDRITQQIVFSRGIRASDVQGDGAAVAPAWRFHSGSDAGALLMLSSPGIADDLQSRRRIVNCMVDNLDSWFKFANASHPGVQLEDIVFICGTLKTTQWGVAVFQDESFRNKDGYVSGHLDAFGNLELSTQVSDHVLPPSHCRTGPHRLPDPARSASTGVSPRPDQCLFVHYYKGKRRLGEEPRRSPPGPHRLVFGSDARICTDAYDPVNHLLDYILQSSEASIAIASDLDLLWLFPDMEFPDDIPGALMQLSPYIDLDERGVGTISFDYDPIRKRKDRDEATVDDGLAREEKRMKYCEETCPSNPSQAYSDCTPAGSAFAEHSYGAIGGPSYHSQAPQDPQEIRYQQGVYCPPAMEYAQTMSYQQQVQQHQGIPYQPTMAYPHGVAYPAMYPPAYMTQQGMATTGCFLPPVPVNMGTYVPPGMPWTTQPTPQDYSPPPHGAPYPSESPVRGEIDLPPEDEDSENDEGDGDDDGTSDNDNDDGIDEDGDTHGDDDEEMAEPSEKAQGKRPNWGAPTTVHDGSVTALAYSADGKYVASGSEDTIIIIWDAPNNAMRHRVPQLGDQGHTDAVYALAFSPDNLYLASASLDEEVITWAVANGREHLRLSPGCAIYSLAYTPDGRYLIGGAGDGTLHLWDAQTYEPVRTLTKNATVVTFIIFSADGQLMATGGTEDVCYVWETARLLAGKPLSVLTGHRGMVCAAAFSPDGARIATAADDSSARIWNARTGEAGVLLHEHAGPVWTVAFAPDGRRVASGSSDATVKVCDAWTGECVLALDGHGHEGMVNAVAFSPDGRFIASAASDNTVRLWRAADGAHQATYNEHNDNVTLVMFAADGSTLTSGSHDGTALIRSLRVAQ